MRIRYVLFDARFPNAIINRLRPTRLYASTAYSLAFAFNDGVGYFAGTATIEGYATDGTLLWETLEAAPRLSLKHTKHTARYKPRLRGLVGPARRECKISALAAAGEVQARPVDDV